MESDLSLDAAKGSELVTGQNSLHIDLESKVLDPFGKIYASETVVFRIVNCQMHMIMYQRKVLCQLIDILGEIFDTPKMTDPVKLAQTTVQGDRHDMAVML